VSHSIPVIGRSFADRGNRRKRIRIETNLCLSRAIVLIYDLLPGHPGAKFCMAWLAMQATRAIIVTAVRKIRLHLTASWVSNAERSGKQLHP
jgi:hypothetical protein